MSIHFAKFSSRLVIAIALFSLGPVVAQAQWTKLANAFPGSGHAGTCLLLTDGTVMCHEFDTNHWHRLNPDNTGSYVNGTWDSPKSIADMPNGTDLTNVGGNTCSPTACTYAPRFFSSAVLADGRVVVIGGEYNTESTTAGLVNSWTTIGFMYDPTTNSWSSQLTQPFGTFLSNSNTIGGVGDSQSVILQNKTLLIAGIFLKDGASFDPSTLAFSFLGSTGKADTNDEEAWTILPGGKVLTVDARINNAFEIYDPSTNAWTSPGNTAGIDLADSGGNCNSQEIGPAVSRPDGTVVNFTGNPAGQNAVYDIASGTWSHPANVDFPAIGGQQFSTADAPASLMPVGSVLVQASPACVAIGGGKFNEFNTPSHFFEWDGTTLTQVADPLGGGAANLTSYQGRMLLLPSGDVLYTGFNQNQSSPVDVLQTYNNGGTPQDAWRPGITTAPSVIGQGQSYRISGTMFNGFSQGASYGDDAQMATNWPLVRITNTASTHVVFAHSHDHSRMGVEAVGDLEIVSTEFDVPANLELGASTLVVVTNGIPSKPVNVTVELGTALAFTGASGISSDFNDPVTVQALLTSGGNPVSGETVTFVLGSGAGTESCSKVTDGSGLATCQITPNQAAGGYTLSATFGGDATYAGSLTSTAFTILLEQTAIVFTGASATNADYNDAATVQAQLTTDGNPLANEAVTISLGSGGGTETCSVPATGAGGLATCQITPTQQAGTYTITATFAGDPFYAASTATAAFTINREETTTKFTLSSPTVIAYGHPTTFSATLLEDGVTPIQGRAITIAIGSQSCLATPTDSTGTASCTITISQVLGPGTVTASFADDPFYLPSSASEPVIVFAFLGSGSMVIGNLDSNPVEFWGAQWAKSNLLSAGAAPNSFKGFADIAPQACGGGWMSSPGNSSGPPAGPLPSYMGVIVSSAVVQSGDSLSGDVPKIVVVVTNPGYAPNPGHAGTGNVVAIYCGH